jgi:prepilin-type N-terminal cleavage/methylation domain-containing protein
MTGKNSGKIKKSKKGFTLIEMLMVVFVVGIGLVGALSFFSININNQNEVKSELVAAGLAQEGADLVRNKIDYEKLKGTSWPAIVTMLNGAACTRIDHNSLSGTHPCYKDADVSSEVCFSGGRYQQCAIGTTGIGMTRKIEIVYDNLNTSLAVKCTVSWGDRSTVSNDVIYNNSY